MHTLSQELKDRLTQDFNTEESVPASALDVQVGGDHYKNFAIQPAEFFEANKLPWLEGCIIGRICRHGNKNGIEDLKKAIHEIQLLAHLRYGEKL